VLRTVWSTLLHQVAAATGPDLGVADGLASCADVNRDRGDLHRAAELFLKSARMSGAGAVADGRLMEAVSLFLLAGDVVAAKALSEPLGQVVPSPVQYVGALVVLGRLDEAAAEIASFEVVARTRSSRSRLAGLARVRGELATARRDHRTARASLEESLELGTGSATALDEALTDASYGRFLRRRGEKRAAVERLQTARAKLVALGATPFVRRCESELSACGVEGQPGEPARSALTPQEQIVASLVCQRMTNQQVARQLVLSVKTVGYHLSNVYTKLDVHSRTQLLTVLGRAGVVGRDWQRRG